MMVVSLHPTTTTTPTIAALSSSPLSSRLLRRQPLHLFLTRQDGGERPSTDPPRSRRPSLLAPALAASSRPAIHQDEEGNCVFGKKEYWDEIYGGDDLLAAVAPSDRRPSESYSWYCGWDELRPFWTMLVPERASRVVIAGVGNDPTPVGMYDDGWTNMMAYDYSRRGVDRARELFAATTSPGGRRRDGVELITADATDLPLETASVDATLDKGTLDAIYITGKDSFRDSVREMGRVTARGGCVVTISRVIGQDVLLGEFDTPLWENVHDGGLAFAEDGEATIDLGAELFSWKRTGVPFE